MSNEFWIIWGCNSHPGHVHHVSSYKTERERMAAILDKSSYERDAFISSTFKTDKNGDVI